jgi:hypothetical protein
MKSQIVLTQEWLIDLTIKYDNSSIFIQHDTHSLLQQSIINNQGQ